MAIFNNVTLLDVLRCAPELDVQLASVVVHSAVWALAIRVLLPPVFSAYVRKMKSKKQFLRLAREWFKANLFYDMGEDEENQIQFVAEFQGIILQHCFGGFLTVPSAMGLGGFLPAGMAASMARHGGLCEVGFEVQDTIARGFQLLFGGQRGREKNPPALLIVIAIHHTCALCLVLPLNLYYPEDTHYHEGIMLLQLAAFVAFTAQQFGWTLDVKSRAGLDQMRMSVLLSWITIVWSRALRYGYVWYALLTKFANESDPFLFRTALAPVVCMSLFNLPLILDVTSKLVKFCKMTVSEDGEQKPPAEEQRATLLPRVPDSQETRRRLKVAAKDVSSSEEGSPKKAR